MPVVLIMTAVAEKLVLLILFGLSIWSVSIIIAAKRKFRAFATKESVREHSVEEIIKSSQWQKLEAWTKENPGLLTAGSLGVALSLADVQASLVDRAIKSYLTGEKIKLEKGLSVLATLGANAPFIGLFGTVLGIIRSFAALADNQGNATNVMSGISQALYATAAGLFVAIPAVIAYNAFSSQLRSQVMSSEGLKDLYLAYRGGGHRENQSGNQN